MKAIVLIIFLFSLNTHALAIASECIGSTSHGRLVDGVKLPEKGPNFVAYGTIPVMAGRTYIHSTVKAATVQAYKILEKMAPGKLFKYAETGFKKGGQFNPHKTHQNGLSIDFMVPVINHEGESVHLPTHAFNRYGYDIEFDEKGVYKTYQIDYDAMGAHLAALHKAAITEGIDIWRVIFDPALQPYLYNSQYGAYIRDNIYIPTQKSWVRHDEHYHVDFKIECEAL